MSDECQYCMFYGREINKLEAEISNLRAELEAERSLISRAYNFIDYNRELLSHIMLGWLDDVEERQAQRSGK